MFIPLKWHIHYCLLLFKKSATETSEEMTKTNKKTLLSYIIYNWAMGFVVLLYFWHGNRVQAERISKGMRIIFSIFFKTICALGISNWFLNSPQRGHKPVCSLFYSLLKHETLTAWSIFSTWKENMLYTLTATNKECVSIQLHLVVLSWQKESYRILFDSSMTFCSKPNVKFCLESPCTLSIMNSPLQVLHK